jgi:hypothetical protein
MGQYKVPQDVEAEDKLIGPLTLRQFIYIVVALAWGGLMWRIFNFNVALMIIAIIPVSGFFILLGVGRRQEQSFENYFVALMRFLFVPRIRVWDKDISHEMIVKAEETKPEVIIEKNVNKGSLQQLALIMDTYGYKKDPTIQLQDSSNQATIYGQRILDPSQIAGNIVEQPITQRVTAQDDMLDTTSARSNEVGQLLENVEIKIHNQALANMKKGLQSSTQSVQNQTTVSQPQTSDVILKKAMLQGANLTIQQISKQANEQVIPEGQSINISTT